MESPSTKNVARTPRGGDFSALGRLGLTVGLCVLALASGRVAGAEPTRHWAVGCGGYLALTGAADYGAVANGEFYPAGSFGRFGVRGEYRSLELEPTDGLATVGVLFDAAASRPRLQLALHADAGVTFSEPKPVIAGGIQTHLGIVGPLAAALDSTLHLIIDGPDTTLVVAGSLTIRLAR